MKMCQAFAQNMHDVTLIVPNRKKEAEEGVDDIFSFYNVCPCFKIIQMPWISWKGKGYIFALLAVKEAQIMGSDIIYTRDVGVSYFTALYNHPVVFESHSPMIELGKIHELIFRRMIRKASFKKLVVISHSLHAYYEKHYPTLLGKVQVAPDGANPISENTKGVIFSNRETRLQVGYIGHLYPGRGIEIIEQLAGLCQWADFHVIGGTEVDINSCKMRVKSLDNLFFHGFKRPSEVDSYRLGCDVLLAPYQRKVSVSGGTGNTVDWMSPLKLFEYMAAGKAIISSDLPVLREVLVHQHNALLCEPDDIISWKNALVFLNKFPEVRLQLGERAKKDFLREYTWQSRAENVLRGLR